MELLVTLVILNSFSSKVKRDPVFKELNFNSLSIQSVHKRLPNF